MSSAEIPFDQDDLEDTVALMRCYSKSPRTEMDCADASLVRLAADTGTNRLTAMDVPDSSRHRLPDGRAFESL